MEITALSKSWTSDWSRYLATRFVSLPMAALLLLLLATSWCVSLPTGAFEVLTDLAIATLLLLEFRLWDDLSDVQIDRARHPNRVLPRSAHLASFWWLLAIVATLAGVVAAWSRTWQGIAAFVAIHLLLAAWYRMPRRTVWETANYHFVLLKYPAFVVVLSMRHGASWGVTLIIALLSIYLALCVYEVWHDDRLRSRRVSRTIAGLEAGLLLLLVFGTYTRLGLTNHSDMSTSAPSGAAMSAERNRP